jgi:hypothetical protein
MSTPTTLLLFPLKTLLFSVFQIKMFHAFALSLLHQTRAASLIFLHIVTLMTGRKYKL